MRETELLAICLQIADLSSLSLSYGGGDAAQYEQALDGPAFEARLNACLGIA